MKKRLVMAMATGMLIAAMLPGITLGATESGGAEAVAAASAKAGASTVVPTRHKNNKKHGKQYHKPKPQEECAWGCHVT